MLTIINLFLDFIFPPRGSEKQVRSLLNENISSLYHPRTHESVQYLLSYQTEAVRSLIQENKFHKNESAAKLLAGALERYLKENSLGPTILIPIPLSNSRLKSRGYNQVGKILKELPAIDGLSIATKILSRTKDTPPQTTLERAARLKNMKGAFIVNLQNKNIENSTVIIIDDVVTTSATLSSARAALTPHLPSTTRLVCLALAH